MGKFDIDLSGLGKIIYTDPNRIPVKGNEEKMVRVAFDVFKLRGDDKEDLWTIQADDDGEFLVRTYSLPEDEGQKITESSWDVKTDSKKASLTIYYKNIPIQKLASKDFDINTSQDMDILRGVVFRKLALDKDFVVKFFNDLSGSRQGLLKQAGLLEDLKNWLMSKDITDELQEKLINVVETHEPDFAKYFLNNEEKDDAEMEAKDYQEFFKDKAEEFGAPSGDPQDIPVEKRKEFFEEVDKNWKADNECGDTAWAALELELRIKGASKKQAEADLKKLRDIIKKQG